MFSRERPNEDEKLMNIPGGGGMKGIWGSEAKTAHRVVYRYFLELHINSISIITISL